MSKISEDTIKVYENYLNNLKENGIDINNINIGTLKYFLDKRGLSLSTQDIIISAILWYSKKHGYNQGVLDILSNIMREHRRIKDIEYKNSKNMNINISWKDVVRVQKRLKILIIRRKDLFLDYMLLSLYIYQPVRRIGDYLNMYLDDNQVIYTDPNCILWSNMNNIMKYGTNYNLVKVLDFRIMDNRNYYKRSQNGGYFIFNDYKMKKQYGRQIIEVNNTLNNILNKYIEINNLKDGDKLINLTRTVFANRINTIFEMILNKHMTVSALRDIYADHILSNHELTGHDIYIIGQKMAHPLSI